MHFLVHVNPHNAEVRQSMKYCPNFCRRPAAIGLLLFFTLLNVHSIFAQGAEKAVSLPAAWKIVREKNYSVQELQNRIQQAQQEISILKTQFLPVVAVRQLYNYVSKVAQVEVPIPLPGVNPFTIQAGVKNQYDMAILIKQPVFTGFRTRNLVLAGTEQKRIWQLQKTILLHKLYLQTGQLYYAIQLNVLEQRVLVQSIQRAGDQLENVRNLFRAHQAIQFDTLEVANRRLAIQNQLKKLKNFHQILLGKFRFLLNINESISVPDITANSLKLKLKSQAFYEQLALKNRPEIQQLTGVQRAQSFRKKAIRSAFFPQIYANAAYHYARPGVNFFKNQWMKYATIGVNAQWQLWNWGQTRHQMEKSELEIQRIGLQRLQLQNQIRQEIVEACQYLQNAKEQILLQKKLVLQERKRFNLIKNKYAQGLATNTDVSSAEKALTTAELLLQKDKIDWFHYRLQLDYAAGVIGQK
ncbi:outer membrane efflux protein [bacterium BMS3Abin05]|nr:outer membrane efflux protein [bacterium BMS3Abin05]